MDTIHYKPGVARDWRRARKLTQDQAAASGPVSRPTIARIETGDPTVSVDSLAAVARFYQKPISELLVENEQSNAA